MRKLAIIGAATVGAAAAIAVTASLSVAATGGSAAPAPAAGTSVDAQLDAAAVAAGQPDLFAAKGGPFRFSMVRSANAEQINCLPKAQADVTITQRGPVEVMRVRADGLPAKTDFDLFVIQVPNAPFGLSWYQGDLESDEHGHADQTYVGRFSDETFTVAPGTAPAPVEHHSPIADADHNPVTAPVHQFHLGVWFNSPADATKAGCQGAVTPFNGEHNAGVQALSTRNFADGNGPLRHVKS
jgi:hypothetical protein